MSNLFQLANGLELRNAKEVVQYANTQYLALQTLDQKNKDLEAEVAHLKELLSCNTIEIIKTPEHLIVEEQISRIQKNSLIRELSNEEIKSLDLLIKNKRLLSGDSTDIPGEVTKKKPVSKAQLIQIAKQEK